MNLLSHKKPKDRGTVARNNQASQLSPLLGFEREESKLKELERQILSVRVIEGTLRRVTKAGADRAQVLRLLSLTIFETKMGWRREVKRQQSLLRSLARRLKTAMEDYERLARDPRAGPHFWLALIGMMPWSEVTWPAKEGSKSMVLSMMQTLVESAKGQASELGRVLRTGPLHSRRQAILALSHYIHNKTGHYHDDEVADLLNYAHEAVGSDKLFTASTVKKLRQRHLRPLK